jgi:antitoxin MazE
VRWRYGQKVCRIVIEPSSQLQYELSNLLEGITPDNAHSEVDVGMPIGKELL